MKGIAKITSIVLIALITVMMLAGCSKKAIKNPDLSTVEETIMKNINTTDTIKLDDKKLERVYDIKAEELDGYFVYVSTSNIKADEIAVFRVKDASKVDNIKEKIDERMLQLGKSFEDYLPEQFTVIQDRVVEVNGNYVCVIVSKDVNSIVANFNKCFE